MSDPVDPTVRHPDELLAGYVDGSATPDERAVVDQHLATCAACQEEVQLATEARAALISLPELGAPGLAEAGVLALRRAAFQTVPADQPDGATGAEAAPTKPSRIPATVPAEPRSRRPRVAWAQLAAAAPIVVVLGGLVAIPLALSHGGSKASRTALSGNAPEAAPSVLPLVDRGAKYSQDQLDVLARQLGTAISRGSPSKGQLAAASPLPPPPTGPAVRDAAAASTAQQCVLSGSGAPDGAQLVYLERAEFMGTPAYIGGFLVPNAKLNIMAVAVTQDGCQPLYSVRQSA
jgi:anti-sigma factor RsiW